MWLRVRVRVRVRLVRDDALSTIALRRLPTRVSPHVNSPATTKLMIGGHYHCCRPAKENSTQF